jgi:hypothetical protein
MRKLVFVLGFVLLASTTWAQTPHDIKLEMTIEDFNKLFQWPILESNYTGYYDISTALLINKNSGVVSFGGYVQFKNGVLTGYYKNVGYTSADVTGKGILTIWNSSIPRYTELWGEPVIIDTTKMTPAKSFYEGFEKGWVLNAVFPNGYKLEVKAYDYRYFRIQLTLGDPDVKYIEGGIGK